MKPETNGRRHRLSWLAAILLLLPGAAMGEGSSVLWSIENDGQTLGYLLGTVHSEDPRVAEPPTAIETALDESEVFAMEIVPGMDSLSRLNQAMYYSPGTGNLEDVVGAELFDELVAHLQDYGLLRDQALTLKPWAAAVMISVPPPDTGLFMDFAYAMRASAKGLEVVSLETVDQQLAFLQGLEPEQELEMLRQAVADYDQMDTVHEALMQHYLSGDLGALQAFTDAQMEDSSAELQDWFQVQGLDRRNQGMLDEMLKHLAPEEGEPVTLFTAVGALHLPGEQGLIQLLRDQGYTLTPIPVRFPTR